MTILKDIVGRSEVSAGADDCPNEADGTMRFGVVLAAAVLIAAPAAAQDGFDEWNAKDIMRTCAPCHGEFGQGGGGGVYPRLAGMNADYLAEQIAKFKSRERENIPMIPFANDRELPARDIRDVTRYLAGITLATRLPETTGPVDGLERLLQAKMLMQIPRADGDIERGKQLYGEQCGVCHGREGQGRVTKPPLAGQHTDYLQTQITNFKKGNRPHPDNDELFMRTTRRDMDDILAYMSVLDD